MFPEDKGLGKRFEGPLPVTAVLVAAASSAATDQGADCTVFDHRLHIYPMLTDVKLLARLLGLPYLITPLFREAGPVGLVPLPSKWRIAFSEPVCTADYASTDADDPMVTFELTDQVRETIQRRRYTDCAGRRNIFSADPYLTRVSSERRTCRGTERPRR